MPRKIKDVTKDYLVNVPLPNHADTYTVISHQSIIDYAYTELANHGFTVVSEEYRATHDGQIAQGIHKLQFNSDPEMSLMFAWANSYNKQIRFKCAIGGYVNNNKTVMIGGEMGSYARKHTGTADADTIASMKSQITNAQMYYTQLLWDKDMMKTIFINSKRQAELLGVLFAEYEILNTEQASIVRQEMDKPSFFYNGGSDTLWAFYNHVTVALQQSHPRSWMEDQRMLHWVITNEFDLSAQPAVDMAPVEITEPLQDPLYEVPNQTNILDQIEELEQAQYPLTPDDAFVKATNEFSMAQLAGVKAPEDVVTPCAAHDLETIKEEEAENIFPLEETLVQYTDPIGNVFEAPIVEEKSFNDVLGEAMIAKANFIEVETPFSLEPTPEDVDQYEKEMQDDFLSIGFNFDLDDDNEEGSDFF